MKWMPPLLMLLVLNVVVSAQEPTSTDSDTKQIHDQLRELRERMVDAYEKRDVDALLKDVEDNVVITWQNGDRNLNHAEFLKFYDEMLNGDSRIVKEMSSDFVVDGNSLIYGDDTAVAYGTCTDRFVLTSGSEFELISKWTATVVKNEEGWKIASFHMSANIFENPILGFAKGWLVKAGIIGGIVGVILGFLLALVMRRKPAGSSPQSEDKTTL